MTDIVNCSGTLAKSYKYDAFGNILQETGPAVPGGMTYTGRQYHTRSGLYYYRARFYDPRIGRFITQDPIGQNGGVNLYAYVGNKPTMRIDPTGLLFELIWNNPNERAQHSDEAITMNEFITYTHGKSLEEVQHEMDEGARRWDSSAEGPSDRYVINPNNPNEALDMRHFLVVGPSQELGGLIVEILQWGDESSFNAQDFLSNALGADFFVNYRSDQPLDMQLFKFFSTGNRICPAKR